LSVGSVSVVVIKRKFTSGNLTIGNKNRTSQKADRLRSLGMVDDNKLTRRDFACNTASMAAGTAFGLTTAQLVRAGNPDRADTSVNEPVLIENDVYRLVVARNSGAVTSLFIKGMNCELISEPRLADNFRLSLPLPDYQANYIEGMQQSPKSIEQSGRTVTVRFAGMKSDRGEFPVELAYTIALDGDQVRFRAKLTNHHQQPIAEFWFPRLGGWTKFGDDRSAALATPGYTDCGHGSPIFKQFPGGQGLGAEAAEFSKDYPGAAMVMPWWSLHDQKHKRGLYLGYHDQTLRLSTWHTYLLPNSTGTSGDSFFTPEQAKGQPVGLVFSHVRYPFIRNGETFESGEFIVRVHDGDWHAAAKYYRKWFMQHFPFDKSRSWLRKQSVWFSSIIYQPEDKVIADFKTYARWCAEARHFDVNCCELIGWHQGGLERGYPDYVAEPKLGGPAGFRDVMHSVHQKQGRVLAFVNYNVLDSATDFYREKLQPYTHQDQFGATPNWMSWGESTLLARKGMNVRRHLLASIVPPITKRLEDHFVRIAEDGADGLQIDKLVVSTLLDFNALNTRKPDEALHQGLVDGIERLYRKCRAINPNFCLAAEALQDRLIPYVDVFYRAVGGFSISPLRYAFPEWTACVHVGSPRDFNGVNAAVMLGAVLCIEPQSYQASLAHPLYTELANYIKETERIRRELRNTIFTADYFDTLEAVVTEVQASPGAASGQMHWRVHGNRETGRRAIVVVNASREKRAYTWAFQHRAVGSARLYEPSCSVRQVRQGEAVVIPGERFQVLAENLS
jgi:hypothetical protein